MSRWPHCAFAQLATVAALVVSLTSCESVSGSPQPPTAPSPYTSPPPPSVLAAARRYAGGDEFDGPGIDPRLWGVYDSVGRDTFNVPVFFIVDLLYRFVRHAIDGNSSSSLA